MAYLEMRDHRKLYYAEEGSGQPVVFIHGWKASSDVYAETSRILTEAGGLRCIRYDQCGHMRSEIPEEMPTLTTLAEDLHEVITQLRLERPILVGWSMGGSTILEYLQRYGCEGLDRIVIVDMSPCRINDETWPYLCRNKVFTREAADANAALMRKDFHEFMRVYYNGGIPGFAQKSAAEQDAVIEERMKGHDSRVLIPLMECIYHRDYRGVLPKITCPTGIFHADLLPVCSEKIAQYYADRIPAPVMRVCFQNASHSLISEQTEEFAAKLKKFFEM